MSNREHREQYKHLLNYSANFILLAVEAVLFGWAWYSYYMEALVTPFFRRGNWAVIGLYVLIIFFFTKVFGGYAISYMRTSDIALSNILAIGLSGVVGYFELCLIGRDYLNPRPMLIVMAAEVVFTLPWIYFVRRFYKWLYPPRQMLVIYGEYSPDELIKKINSRRDKYNICASISCYVGDEQLQKLVCHYNAVVLADLPAEERNRIMKFCFQKSIRTYVTPKISDIMMAGADDIHLFDTPLLLMRNQGLSIDQRIIKRILDVILSFIGILIASPFMILIALAVKLYDGGPVFYSQERLTINGRPFKILKFRSMSVTSEAKGARLAAKGDARVTPVGNVIRNIHFDELPQLFNIFKGDMSMVGPRPERQEISDEYESIIPEFPFRTKVKAGLTGYAQVYGKYNTTPYDKLKMDMTYIENYSLWLDFKIMLRTFKILFQKENTEGVDESQKTALKS